MDVRSSLLDNLAQLLVLYEHLRIEIFSVTKSAEGLKGLDAADKRDRMQDSLGRFIDTLLEFEGALFRLSQTDEYKSAKKKCESDREMKSLIGTVSKASQHFRAQRETLKSLGDRTGRRHHDDAAVFAARNADSDAMAKREGAFHQAAAGAGIEPHDARRNAAAASAKTLAGVKPGPEEIKDVICVIRDGYAHATRAMDALVEAFVRDQF